MEDRSFYVYAHYRLDTMEPFYIGKGKDGRKDILSRNTIHDRISKKHGHAVVILYDNLTEEEAFFYERETIEDLVFNEGYEIHCKNCGEFTGKFSYLTNFSFGGEGISGHSHNEETKKKMSKAQSKAQIKRYEDKKEREKLSITVKKYFEDPYNRKKTSEANKKYFEDPDNRKKTSEAVKKFWKNITPEKYEEFCKINSENNLGEKNVNAKKVYCNELNIIFSYVKLAEKYCINVLNSKIGPINRVCNGKRKSSGKLADGTKLTWSWLENVDKEILDKAEFIDSKKYEELLSQNVNDCK